MRVRVKSLELLMLMVLFSALAAVFLFFIGIDALNDRHPFAFFVDSNTYHKTYVGESETFDGTLVGVDGNYLGPLLILTLLGGNPYLVMLLNVCIYYFSVARITSLLRLDPLKVGMLLLLSPMTVSTLLSVNKEILVFPFIAFALTAYMRRSWTWAGLALIVSILSRWQLTAFYLIMLMITMSPVRVLRHRGSVLGATLLAASLMYLLLQSLLEPVIAAVEASIENYDGGGSGLFEALLGYQKQGLYFLIFPLKALHLLFASSIRLRSVFDTEDIYNVVFVASHCAVTLVVFGALWLRRSFTLKSDLIFATVLFLAVFCLSPIYAPRYLYAVFVLWALVLAGAPVKLRPPHRRIARLPMTETARALA